MSAQKSFWISWYGTAGPFTLESPWWISGARHVANRFAFDEVREEPTIVAAVRADNEADAKGIICTAHDRKPANPEWRFCYEQPDGWSPFSERFPRADWMKWPEPTPPSPISHAGEGPEPSTLAAAGGTSPSASGRGQPAPEKE